MNRPQPRVSAEAAPPIPLPSIPEGQVVGVMTRESSVLPVSAPEDSSPVVSLRGKRDRKVSWDSASERSSTEHVTPTAVPTSLATVLSLSAPRPRRKKRKKGASSLVASATAGAPSATAGAATVGAASAATVGAASTASAATAATVVSAVSCSLPCLGSPASHLWPPTIVPVSLTQSAASSPAPSSCSSVWSPATVSMSSLNFLPLPTSPGSPHPASLPAPWNSAPTLSVSPITSVAALSQFVLPGTVPCVSTPKPVLKTPTKATRSPRPQPSPIPPGPRTPSPPSPTPSHLLLFIFAIDLSKPCLGNHPIVLKHCVCVYKYILNNKHNHHVCIVGVRCGDWSISLPEKIEALRGSCVTINCTFTINNTYNKYLTDSAAGVWFKDGCEPNRVLDSNRPENLYKGNITGKLKDKDCTTIFYDVTLNHKGRFNFRIEGNGPLIYTYRQKTVSIDVIDSPPKPTVQMFKDQMEVEVHEEVLEGSSMCLRCSAKTLCSSSPPTLTWSSTNRLHLNENSRLQLDQQNQTEIISDLNFTATHLRHGVTFICTITYQLQQRNTTAKSKITLRVQYAPKDTSVSVFPSNSVLESSSVTLRCSSNGNPAVLNYTWYRENEGQLEELQTGYNLTFNVTDRTYTGRYYCQTKNQHGTQNTSVLLDIQYCQQTLTPLLIILTLILILYALTVGFALYRIRQLSNKLKVHNDAGIYASLQLSAPVSEYETLIIKKR
ncbi:uncharacterized protein [Misgurnus anguillicaudatus]|uniref:uncharacterized protein n=1 Tax=Misgurnus anguillicaudatus TaxID=75329 RepID=UPI003CCF0368